MIYHIFDLRRDKDFFEIAKTKKDAIKIAREHDKKESGHFSIVQRLKKVRIGMHWEYERTLLDF